jgi:ketosteroid isomerase-like protein
MKRGIVFSVIQIFATSFLFFHCDAQQAKDKSNLEEARIAIAKSNEIYFQAFEKGESSKFIDRYTYDCWIMPPNSPTLCGIDAPLDFFNTAYYQFGIRNGKFITIGVFGDGEEFVTEVGFYHLFDAKNVMLEDGKYLVLWKKTAGGWKMFRDSFNSSQKSQ